MKILEEEEVATMSTEAMKVRSVKSLGSKVALP